MALEKVDGVEEAEASYESSKATVTFDPNATSPADFIAEFTRLTGFTVTVVEAIGGMTEPDSMSASDGSHIEAGGGTPDDA